jgi:hypothetical protein
MVQSEATSGVVSMTQKRAPALYTALAWTFASAGPKPALYSGGKTIFRNDRRDANFSLETVIIF